MNSINLNDNIKVKLTDYGKEIYYHRFDDVLEKYPGIKIKPSMPKVDADGYTEFQLWDFINTYGNYMSMGNKQIIDLNEIYLITSVPGR